MIHTVKGFGVVNKAEVDVFLELSCFFDDPTDVGNLISASPPRNVMVLGGGALERWLGSDKGILRVDHPCAVDDDYSHKIKGSLLLGRKTMANLGKAY